MITSAPHPFLSATRYQVACGEAAGGCESLRTTAGVYSYCQFAREGRHRSMICIAYPGEQDIVDRIWLTSAPGGAFNDQL